MYAIIVVIPGLWAAYMAWTQSPHRAFLNVYVPVLLFFPSYYIWNISGLPDPSFQTATIVPIFIIWWIRGSVGWRFSPLDIVIFIYAFSLGFSEYINAGYKDAQNFVINSVFCSVLMPYILAKSLIEPAGLREDLAKRIVLVLLIVIIGFSFQTVTGSSYSLWQKVLGRFFGGQGWSWHTQFRWGIPRADGPYGHAILAGIIMVVGYRIQRWLEWSRAWPNRFHWRRLRWFPLSPARVLTFTLFVGALMTLVRGPLSAGIIAAILLVIGRTTKRWLIFGLLLIFLIVVGIPVVNQFIDYASTPPEETETVSHSTVAYRWQLIINYIDVAKQRMIWGWGRLGWPKIKGKGSIDNHFLLLFLRHGLMGLGAFTFIFLFMMMRLFFHAMLQPLAYPPGSSLGFTLFSLYVVYGWSLATVYMGEQTLPFFFLIVGWSEGYLMSGGVDKKITDQQPTALPIASSQSFQFRRVFK